MSDLPTNIDTTYENPTPAAQAHQQHHDAIHKMYNLIDGANPNPGLLGLASANIVVSPTDPGLQQPGLWIQTGLGPSGSDFTFWIEDGT